MSDFRDAATRTPFLLLLGLLGCASQKVLEEPQTLTLEKPLVAASDERLSLWLDWVVVRNGAGSWVRDANWDQYLLRVGNLSAGRIRLSRVVLYDSLETVAEPGARPEALTRASRETSRRYRGAGREVKAGVGGKDLVAAGVAAGIVGNAVGYAVLTGAASPAAAGFAIGALAAAPVLLVGGIVQNYREDRIAREMVARHTPLPYDLDPATQHNVSWFFPLSPSPRRLEVTYRDDSGEHMLMLDLHESLEGLHMGRR